MKWTPKVELSTGGGMAKLTYEDKKEIARLYYEEYFGCTLISRKINITENIVKLNIIAII